MKGALGKKELLAVVPLSWSTIDRMERAGEFPKRWYITDKRCAWNRDEVERWLDERQAASPAEFQGKKPPVQQRVYRPVHECAAKALEQMVRMVLIPGLCFSMALSAGINFQRGLD
jgi:prophage regulatory protein